MKNIGMASEKLYWNTFRNIKVFRKLLAEVEYLGNNWNLLFRTISSLFLLRAASSIMKCFSYSCMVWAVLQIIRVIKKNVTSQLVTLMIFYYLVNSRFKKIFLDTQWSLITEDDVKAITFKPVSINPASLTLYDLP